MLKWDSIRSMLTVPPEYRSQCRTLLSIVGMYTHPLSFIKVRCCIAQHEEASALCQGSPRQTLRRWEKFPCICLPASLRQYEGALQHSDSGAASFEYWRL